MRSSFRQIFQHNCRLLSQQRPLAVQQKQHDRAMTTMTKTLLPNQRIILSSTIRSSDSSIVNGHDSNLSMQQQQVLRKRTMVVVTQTSSKETDSSDSSDIAASSSSSKSTNSSIISSSSSTAASGGGAITMKQEETTGSFVETNDIIITASCIQQIQRLCKQRNESPESLFLRVFVDAGGCSGFTYKFEIETETDDEIDDDEDITFLAHVPGKEESVIRVVVDSTSLTYIKGATIDYVQEMIKSGFEVRENPLSESACGCGSSFAVKKFAANPALD